ncbi:MAG: endonuclease/exonuclease/phosphatase family protein [Planctomycetota bacterium]
MERVRTVRKWSRRGLLALRLSLTAGVVLMVLMLIIGEFGRLVGLFDMTRHFQAQYFMCAVFALVLLILLRANRAATIALLVASLTGFRVLPWYIGRPNPDDAAREQVVRVFLSNVLGWNHETQAMLEQIRDEDPDIIVIQEYRNHWEDALATLADRWPYAHGRLRSDAFGMLVLSKTPFDAEVRMFGVKEDSVVGTLTLHGESVSFLAIHPKPPKSRATSNRRDLLLRNVREHIGQPDGPTIVAGDFNATMWSAPYQRFVRDTGLRNARQGFGVLPTWPSQLPVVMRIPIDHVLVTRDITVADFRIGDACGSDHLPVIVDLILPESP